MKKNLRMGKVFVDWSQNDEHKTTIAVYSLRARERPTVSTPVTWEEVELAFKKKDPKLLVFEAQQVLERVQKRGDLFDPLLNLKQKLPEMSGLARKSPAEAMKAGLDLAARGATRGSGKRRSSSVPRRNVPAKRRKL